MARGGKGEVVVRVVIGRRVRVTKDGTKGKEEARRANRCTKKKNNNKMELRGAMEELGNNVHCYGNKRQAKFHTKMTKCIADHVRRECNKDMRKSVNDGMELNLVEPTEPEGKETTCEMKKCEKDLAQHHEKLDKLCASSGERSV